MTAIELAVHISAEGGVVGLYDAVTLAPYRRRGFGAAQCRRALLDAWARGYGTVVLQAEGALDLGVYARLGFKPFGEIVEFKPS